MSDLIFKICSLYYDDPEDEIENKYSKNWLDYFWLIELEMLKKYCYQSLKSDDEHSDLLFIHLFLWIFKFPVEHLTSRGDGHIIRADNFPLQIWDNPPSCFLSTLKGFLKQQAIRRFLWHAYSGLDEQCINSAVG